MCVSRIRYVSPSILRKTWGYHTLTPTPRLNTYSPSPWANSKLHRSNPEATIPSSTAQPSLHRDVNCANQNEDTRPIEFDQFFTNRIQLSWSRTTPPWHVSRPFVASFFSSSFPTARHHNVPVIGVSSRDAEPVYCRDGLRSDWMHKLRGHMFHPPLLSTFLLLSPENQFVS